MMVQHLNNNKIDYSLFYYFCYKNVIMKLVIKDPEKLSKFATIFQHLKNVAEEINMDFTELSPLCTSIGNKPCMPCRFNASKILVFRI